MKLTGQIQNKLKKPSIFSGESHLQPTDPGYGTPQVMCDLSCDLTTDLTTDLCLVLQEGSLTAERGQQAHRDIAREVVDMCQVIWDHALMTDNWDQEDNIACILFQNLFSIYSKISGNVSCKLLYVIYICMKPGFVFRKQVVGLLQRARKYGVVHFEGETLFQGRNNMTPIFVLR